MQTELITIYHHQCEILVEILFHYQPSNLNEQ